MANESIRLLTPVFRMSHPNIVEAKAYKDPATGAVGLPRYSVIGIFEPEDLKKFQTPNDKGDGLVDIDAVDVAVATAKSKWPNETDISGFIRALAQNKKWPFIDGTKEADRMGEGKGEHYRGKKIIKMSSTEKVVPNLHVLEGKKPRALNRGMPEDLKRATSLFVGGNYAYAELTSGAGNTGGAPWVKFYINSIVFVRAGERLGQGSSLIGRFDGITGGSDESHDPTKGLDEEIPF